MYDEKTWRWTWRAVCSQLHLVRLQGDEGVLITHLGVIVSHPLAVTAAATAAT